MTEIAIALAVLIILTVIIIFILFYFGLINGYHPMKKPKDGQTRVACVGDSITYGCMVFNRSKNNYPTVLKGLLGEKYCVNNFGYTNRTAVKDGDYPFVCEKLYQKSLDFNPHIVVILLGSNDSKKINWDGEKFLTDYGAILDSYLSLASKPKVYVIIPPPAFEVKGKVLYDLRDDVIANEICPAVKRIAMERNLKCINAFEVFKGKKELFADGVHPNKKGCKLLAQAVFDALNED
ncbi:MAG: hypothetical protein K2I20_02780 [Clostridia bacterium]|nr:hypothetical protein [Clostridia bacterium]